MKVKIYPEQIYTLEIKGQRFSGWKREGEWEGIVKLTHPEHGVVLIDWPSPHMALMATFSDGSIDGNIIKGSPAIIEAYIGDERDRHGD